MSNNTKISIVTISYNYGTRLEETIKSVINSGYKNLEYIVIDGGSTDISVDIIKKYSHKIDFWVSEKDRGISDALNKGIAKCTGELIGLIHAGDELAPGALSKVSEMYGENNFDFCYGDMSYVGNSGNILYTLRSDPNYEKKISYTMPAMHHPTVFVKKSIYDECGAFSEDYKVAMDYDFLLRLHKAGKKGFYIDSVIAHMHHGGLSTVDFFNGYNEVREISVKNGYSSLMATVRLLLKSLRSIVRVVLEKAGLFFIIKMARKFFWGAKYT